jgi:hypothetical protein
MGSTAVNGRAIKEFPYLGLAIFGASFNFDFSGVFFWVFA